MDEFRNSNEWIVDIINIPLFLVEVPQKSHFFIPNIPTFGKIRMVETITLLSDCERRNKMIGIVLYVYATPALWYRVL